MLPVELYQPVRSRRHRHAVFVPGRECCRTPRLGRRPSGGNASVCCRPGNFTVKLRNNNKNREDLPMDVVPLGPGFAAELRGVTLKDVASDDVAYAVTRAAFEEHSVLVFRDQEVTDELQLAFSRRFGPPEVTKVGSQGTGSHFVILSTVGPEGPWVQPAHRLAMRR